MSRKVIPLHAHLYREPVFDPTGTDPCPPFPPSPIRPEPQTISPWIEFAGWVLVAAFAGACLGYALSPLT